MLNGLEVKSKIKQLQSRTSLHINFNHFPINITNIHAKRTKTKIHSRKCPNSLVFKSVDEDSSKFSKEIIKPFNDPFDVQISTVQCLSTRGRDSVM